MTHSGRLPKLSRLVESEWTPNEYARSFWVEETSGPLRIVAAVSDAQIETMLNLATVLSGPFLILWVLHTSLTGAVPGRYQSPPITFDDVRATVQRYIELFEQDGRSDIWIHCANPEATLVLDQHDWIYAYGPLEKFEAVLLADGFTYGQVTIPSPHAHEFHAEFDDLERAMRTEFEWTITELQPQDLG